MLFESIQAMTGKMQTIEKALKTLTQEHSIESVHLPEDTVIERAEDDAGEALEYGLALVDEDAVLEAKKSSSLPRIRLVPSAWAEVSFSCEDATFPPGLNCNEVGDFSEVRVSSSESTNGSSVDLRLQC
jgi:hypothetical protein